MDSSTVTVTFLQIVLSNILRDPTQGITSGLLNICTLVGMHLDFNLLYFYIYRMFPVGHVVRDQLLPALRGPHRITIRPGYFESELIHIFGHRGGQGINTTYSFIITQNCHIHDFRSM